MKSGLAADGIDVATHFGGESSPHPRSNSATFYVLSLGVAAFWWGIATVATGAATCGGDGGDAHARPGSPAQWFCDGPLHSAFVAEASLVVVAAIHVLAYSAGRGTVRWCTASRWLVVGYLALALYSVPIFLSRG